MQFPKSKSPIIDYQSFFPYFNNTFFVDQSEISDENDINKSNIEAHFSDESSTNISQDSIISLEDEEKLIPLNLLDISQVENGKTDENNINEKIKPELQKFILPKDLFDSSKNKHRERSDEKKLEAKPYIPTKYRINSIFKMNLFSSELYQKNNKNIILECNHDLDKKRKKKIFLERKGDWHCSNCKNINFSFRKECNKCKISKEESEKRLLCKA